MAKQNFTTGQILTANQMLDLQQTAMGGGAATAKTASYVLVAADAGSTVAMNAAGATTITVNTALFAAGDTVFIQNLGAGLCTVTAGTATVSTAGSLILPQYDAGILYFTSASTAIFYDYIQTGATSPLTTKGDLYTFGTSDTRLGVGANGTTLVADSSEATGLKWAAAAAGGKLLQVVSTTTSTRVDSSSATFVSTGLSLSITPTSATSKVLLVATGPLYQTGKNVLTNVRFTRGGSNVATLKAPQTSTGNNADEFMFPMTYMFLDSPATTSSTSYVFQFCREGADAGASAISWCYPTTESTSSMFALEIGA
jgi:hypothetical protein